jgi:hypothetical protein
LIASTEQPWITYGTCPMLNKIDYPGKPEEVQTCQLDFWVSPVVVVDNLIYPAADIQETFAADLDYKLDFFSELLFRIQLDKQTIFETNFQKLNTVRLTKHIDDLIDQQHELMFVLEGKNNNHSCFLGADKKNVTLSVQILFEIEQLPMQNLFYEKGQYLMQPDGSQSASTIMGVNGKQIMQFPSPVYPWLISNFEILLPELKAGH